MRLAKYINRSNWNIGFVDISPEILITKSKLGEIQWMRHNYKDRFFADPFILNTSANNIYVLTEEMLFQETKGRIVELIVDKDSKRLRERFVLLETDSHLSYPAYIQENGKVYVYPENGMSGSLKMYELDETKHKLVNPIVILNEAVADATIIFKNGKYWMTATKYPNTQEQVFLYCSDSICGTYIQIDEQPFTTDRRFSRPAGNFFTVHGQLYRPAQNCLRTYGSALSINKVNFAEKFKEDFLFSINPNSYKYNLGIHTINFLDGMCVVDGYGYLYPLIGRIYYSAFMTMIKNLVKQINHLK